jgi:hypothetical protein
MVGGSTRLRLPNASTGDKPFSRRGGILFFTWGRLGRRDQRCPLSKTSV